MKTKRHHTQPRPKNVFRDNFDCSHQTNVSNINRNASICGTLLLIKESYNPMLLYPFNFKIQLNKCTLRAQR